MLGQYELLGRIAMGGMAEILRARQRSEAGFEKDVVIKRILPQYTDDVDFIRMFQDEAVLAAKLSHPNIVQVFDFKHADGGYFIAMEYVEGFDLRRLLQFGVKAQKPIGHNRAVQITLAVCRGLGHAHDRVVGGIPLKIVHRDVSPHNVLISLAGDVKVMDFGIAKAAARAVKTSTGILKGKLSYMSPEQAMGQPDIDHRVDIYATGILLWEMLAGRRLFAGGSEIEMLLQVQKGEIPSIREIDPTISPELEACLKKFLERDRDQRYQRMKDAEKDLGQILNKLGGPDAAPLDEYTRDVIPPEEIEGLRGVALPDPHHTRTLPEARGDPTAVTNLLERTNSEVKPNMLGAGTSTILTPGAKKMPGQEGGSKKWVVVTAIALAVLAIIGWQLAKERTPPPPVTVISLDDPPPQPKQDSPPLPAPSPSPTLAAAQPPAQQLGAQLAPQSAPAPAPAPTPAKAEKPTPASAAPLAKKKDEKKPAEKGRTNFRTPGRAAVGTPRIEIDGCPIGAVVYDGETPLGIISAANQDSFPVQAGARTISVRSQAGDPIGRPARIAPQQDELENYSCR